MTPWILGAFLLLQTKVNYNRDGQKADPADFTLPVHVRASHLEDVCSTSNKGSWCSSALRLEVLIQGKKYDLERAYTSTLLNPGDYKARIAKDKAKLPEELDRQYDLLMSDGTFEIFDVVGESE